MKVKVVTPQCIARPRSTVMSKMRVIQARTRTTCACMTAVIAVNTVTEVIDVIEQLMARLFYDTSATKVKVQELGHGR